MQIERKYEVEQCVSDDKNRPPLMRVHVGEKDGKQFAEASDGRVAVRVPVIFDEAETVKEALLEPAMLVKARKLAGKYNPPTIALHPDKVAFTDGSTAMRTEVGTTFPNVSAVLVDPKTGGTRGCTVSLDAELLLRLAKALGAGACDRTKARVVRLTLWFDPYVGEPPMFEVMHTPIVVQTSCKDGAIGVLMPCRTA